MERQSCSGLLPEILRWKCSVHGGAGNQILFPGLLVRSVGLCLCTGAEADTGNAVSSHNGHAVGGEGPFVRQWTGLTHSQGLGSADSFVPIKTGVSVLQSLSHLMILRNGPCGEIALDLIDTSRIGGAVIIVHGHLHVVPILFHAGKSANLI